MKLSIFLEDIKANEEEVVFYCCNHLLSKELILPQRTLDLIKSAAKTS